jgi:uncharacterized membrane protein YidH (DUF202 family)
MIDRGVQAERTALAWHRTALSACVATIVVVRYGVVSHAPIELVAAALLGIAAAISLAASACRPCSGSLWRMRVVAALVGASAVLPGLHLLTG